MTGGLRNFAPLCVCASLGGVLAIWAIASEIDLLNHDLVPGPQMVLSAAGELYAQGHLVTDLAVSLKRAAVGFMIGATLGVMAGLLTARVRLFGLLLHPLLNVLRPIPAIAIIPIAIVWFGIGEPSKYFAIAFTVFFAVWLNTDHGASHIPRTYLRASRSLGAAFWREFVEVVVPAAAPHIVAGLRLGAALAFLSLVAAELTGASAGIGYRIQEARQFVRMDRMFVGLIQLGILGALLDWFFLIVSRRIVHWEQVS